MRDYHDPKLTYGRKSSLWLPVPEGESVVAAGSQSGELGDHINHTGKPERANQKGPRLQTLKAISSDVLPPTRLHPLEIPQPSPAGPRTQDHMFKSVSPGDISHANYYNN